MSIATHEQEYLFNHIFENKLTGITIISGDGKFVRVNQTYCDITGYTAEELYQMDVYDITPAYQQEVCRQKINAIFEGLKDTFDFEKRIITKAGKIKWINVKGSILPNNKNQLLAFIADIDDRKNAEEQLLKNQTSLKLANQVADIGTWTHNLENDEVEWSDQMYRILEIPQGKMPPRNEIIELIHPEDRELFGQKIAQQQEFSNLDIKHITASGLKILRLNSRLLIKDGRPTKYYGTVQDITETKKMELRIQDAQKIAKLGWWELDLRTGEAIWSDAIYDIMGLEKGEKPLTFSEYKACIHPEDARYFDLRPTDLKNGWNNFMLRCKRKNGAYTYILTSGKIIFDEDRPVRIIGTNMDITETIEVQNKLKEAQRIARIGWYEYDLHDPRNHKISKEVPLLLEMPYSEDPPNASDYIDKLFPADREDFLCRIRNIDKYPDGWDNQVFRISTTSGKIKYIEGSARVAYENNVPTKIFGTLYDVTRIKKYEQELEKNEINLQALITSMENLVFVLNDQMKFEKVFCNDPTMISMPIGEMVGKTITDLWRKEPGKTISHLAKRAFKYNVESSHTYKFAPKEKELWWQAHIKPIKGENSATWVAIIINDITAKKNAEEELIKTIEREKELSELRAQFVSMASHQFRTPVTVIKSNLELLEMTGIDHPLINKVRKRLKVETDRLVNLMENVMAMGQVQSGNARTTFKRANLSELVFRSKMYIERDMADGRSAEILISGKEKPVNIDINFMEHALNNLIENAYKYSPGAKSPNISIEYLTDKVRVCVRDYGIGIPVAEKGRLFSAFQRASNTGEIPGTGLGLATAKEFVELNYGTIYLNTKANEGTEFCIELPTEKGI